MKGCFKMQLLLLSIRPTDQESAPFKQDFVILRDPKGRGHATPWGHMGKGGSGGRGMNGTLGQEPLLWFPQKGTGEAG